MSITENLRRSSRIKARVKERLPIKDTSSSSDEDMGIKPINTTERKLKNVEENIKKPVESFSNDDISGKALLPVAKVVLEKINLDCKKDLKTSKKNQKRYKSGLTSSESESVSESSDYVPSECDQDETTDSENTDFSNDETHEMKTKFQKQKFILQSNILSTPKRINKKNKPSVIYKDFHMQSDEYFATQSEKIITSDRTLEYLRNTRLTKEKLEQLLANQNYVSSQHKRNIYLLTKNYTSLFSMWYFIMEQGYTVLLYGLGSKRCLINDFHKSISYHPSLVVNGFFPSLTTKDILDGIIIDLLELNCPTNATECIHLIKKIVTKNPKDRLYLLIHNIDGIMLRSSKAQDLLSCLASIPNICVLASVDHINAPLLWDHTKHCNYNFFWWDTTTFLSYQEETSYESSLMVQQSGALAVSSLNNVFLSLTSNAKSIYIILAKYQLNNISNVNITGMAFKDLYRAAREGFLVSSDLALRAQLTEFIDHKLVKIKRNIDSVEHLVIPLSNGLLKQFLEEHDT